MALLDDILTQLQTMGFQDTTYGGISGISSNQIGEALRSHYGLGAQDLPSSMFQTISEDLLQQGLSSAYSPQIQARGASLSSDLRRTLGGQKGQQAFGGFAGSGQAQKFGQQAKDVYGKGMSEVLAQTGQQQMKGLTGVQDMINKWQETAMKIKGDL